MSVNEIILEKLRDKKWFANTSLVIKDSLIKSAEVGLLKRLEEIADVNEFGEVLKIVEFISSGNVVLITFEIRSSTNNEMVSSEIVAWKNGDNYLSRGVIIIEKEGTPTHLLAEKKFNMVNFKKELQTFGMAYPDFIDGKIVKLPQKLAKAIPDHIVKMYYDLGYVYPDNGMILGKTFIFALSISVNDINLIDESKVQMFDLNNREDWSEINDSYFLSIYSRLQLKKII